MQALANSILTYTFSTLVPAVQYNIRLVSRVGSGVMLVQSTEATVTIATCKLKYLKSLFYINCVNFLLIKKKITRNCSSKSLIFSYVECIFSVDAGAVDHSFHPNDKFYKFYVECAIWYFTRQVQSYHYEGGRTKFYRGYHINKYQLSKVKRSHYCMLPTNNCYDATRTIHVLIILDRV